MGVTKHTPGRRLYEACYQPFGYRGSWAGGNPNQRANYERSAKAFLASDPLTAAAPSLHEALVAVREDGAWWDLDRATRDAVEAAISVATGEAA